MRSESTEKQDDYFVLGNRLFVNYNHEQKTRTDDVTGQEIKSWVCDQVILPKNASRAEMIESIVRTKYHSYGAELAAINENGQKYADYLTHRNLAKSIANTYFGVSS
jgi:ATP sulfurylase